MSNIDDLLRHPFQCRTANIIFVLDNSCDVTGQSLLHLNRCMKEVIETVRREEADNYDAEVRISVLSYCENGFCWMGSILSQPLKEFKWKDLSPVEVCDFEVVLRELDRVLKRSSGFFTSTIGAFIPLIIFVTRNGVRASDNLFARLNSNMWFTHAYSFGIVLNDIEIAHILSNLLGVNKEVFYYEDGHDYGTLLKYLTLNYSHLNFDKLSSVREKISDYSEAVVKESEKFLACEEDDSWIWD